MTLQALLIANFEETFLLAMEQALMEKFRLRLCRSGTEALEILRQEPIDLVLLDLTLPEMDGVTVLELAMGEGIRPAVIALSPLINAYVISCAQKLAIGYLIRTPCSTAALVRRLLDLSQSLRTVENARDPQEFVTGCLLKLGLNPRHDGFSYLLDAILSYAVEPDQSFTKQLYPEVGKQHGRSGVLVERSIRSAMDHGWQSSHRKEWKTFFPNCTKRPTAASFIQRFSSELEAWKEEAAIT